MGHMYPENVSKRLINQLHKKNSTLKDLVEDAVKDGLKVSCAEGKYEEEYMIFMAFEHCLAFHVDERNISPVIRSSKQKKVWFDWRKDLLEDEEDYDILDGIILKLSVLGTKRYTNKDICHLESVTS